MTQLRTFTTNQRLVGIGLDSIDLTLSDSLYGPVSYPNEAAARAALSAPTNANYVMWNNSWGDLETAFAALSANDILVLPEREQPYPIDSSKGFMAAGVIEVDGTGPDGRLDGSRDPIVQNPRLWFEMARARRGIIGLGPGAVIEPTDSGWTRGPQPVFTKEPAGAVQRAYFAAGGSMSLSGAQEALIGYEHASPFFGNFRLKGRSFGGVAYAGLKAAGTHTNTTVKRVWFDECWRSHEGVPNAETGGLTFNGGTYLIENCDMVTPKDSVSGGSCVMWNNNKGGVARNIRTDVPGRPSNLGGMWTFWQSSGVNTWENVHINASQSGINLERIQAGFELNWTGGTLSLVYPGNKYHFVGNPSGGAPKINLVGVAISPNGLIPNSLVFNVYDSPGIAKRSWITCDSLPVSPVPSSNWIA